MPPFREKSIIKDWGFLSFGILSYEEITACVPCPYAAPYHSHCIWGSMGNRDEHEDYPASYDMNHKFLCFDPGVYVFCQ